MSKPLNKEPAPRPSDKELFETGVGKVGRSFDDLIRVVEKSTELTPEQLTVGFMFLGQLVAAAHQKATLSLTIAKASNGAFSLDAPPTIVPLAPVAGERLVREGGAPRPDGQAAPKKPVAQEPGVGFLGGDEEFKDF